MGTARRLRLTVVDSQPTGLLAKVAELQASGKGPPLLDVQAYVLALKVELDHWARAGATGTIKLQLTSVDATDTPGEYMVTGLVRSVSDLALADYLWELLTACINEPSGTGTAG